MTMEFEVKNTSTGYKGKVTVMNKLEGGDPDVVEETHNLKPGETVNLTVWDTRYLVLTEVEEIKEKTNPPYSNQGSSNTGQGA